MSDLDQAYQDFLAKFEAAANAPELIEIDAETDDAQAVTVADLLGATRRLNTALRGEDLLTEAQASDVEAATSRIGEIFATVPAGDMQRVLSELPAAQSEHSN